MARPKSLNPKYPDQTHITVLLNANERQALRDHVSINGTRISPFIRNLILDAVKAA